MRIESGVLWMKGESMREVKGRERERKGETYGSMMSGFANAISAGW
jgi:hypothetical protein